MIVKWVVILFLIVILFSLGSALYYLVRDREKSPRMVKALTVRITLSLTLFILLFVAFAFGWIAPHQIGSPLTSSTRK